MLVLLTLTSLCKRSQKRLDGDCIQADIRREPLIIGGTNYD